MSFATIDHHQLHFEWINHDFIQKNSQVLVFLHEGLGSIPQWKDFPKIISDHLKLPALIYERLGYGESDSIIGNRKIDYMYHEAWIVLPELLDYLNINNKIIPIGHSDGASISLLFAAKYPEMVEALVSIAAHVLVEECTVEGVRKVVHLYEEFDLRFILEKYHGSNTDSMFYGWANAWLSPEFRNWNIEKEIAEITSPLLIIQGENDEYASITQVDAIECAVKGNFERIIVPDCGHIPHLQKKEFVLNKIISFIKSHIYTAK